MDGQPLKPLSHGNILIVGAKASNFSEELKTHPRIIIWDSQNEHWTSKNLPSNITAVFVTRWIGHAAFAKIIAEARKKHITMFNPEGTGMIAKQVKELLDMTKPVTTPNAPMPTMKEDWSGLKPFKEHKGGIAPKLNVLIPFILWDKSNVENADVLMQKAHEMNITSTLASLANFVGVQRKKLGITSHRRNTHIIPTPKTVIKAEGLDVSVQMLDDAIKSLQDMRAYLISTTEENARLRSRLDRFRKAFDE
jgi:hypothetical protein